jgi:hypothetical protein
MPWSHGLPPTTASGSWGVLRWHTERCLGESPSEPLRRPPDDGIANSPVFAQRLKKAGLAIHVYPATALAFANSVNPVNPVPGRDKTNPIEPQEKHAYSDDRGSSGMLHQSITGSRSTGFAGSA